MATTATLTSATEAYSVQAELAAAAVMAAQRLQRPSAIRLAQLVAAYQILAAQQGSAAVPGMLAEQGISSAVSATVALEALAGLTSAGYPLSTMFEAIESAAHLSMLVASAVQDAGRNGTSLRMAVTPAVTGYVRMLNPPSCSRCAILAGKFYRWNEGFERHPNCDCRHIPSTESLAGDLTTDPQAYFDSLPTAAQVAERYPNMTRQERHEAGIFSQEEIFTNAGAEAIRNGADISQVVNARRGGMRKAQVFGRDVFHSLEGVTRRGRFRSEALKLGKTLPVRLMPESILTLAKDRDDAIRLLRLYGYVF